MGKVYIETYDDKETIDKCLRCKKPECTNCAQNRAKSDSERGNRGKPVQQVKNGQVIASYHSIKAAGEATGAWPGSIARCAKGKIKSAMGYQWRYCD